MKNDCSCIVPFYNETDRILGVLSVVSKIKKFRQIICVDDGSTDKKYIEIKKSFPNICLLRFSQNRGKSAAIEKALQLIDSKFVFLIDGDLKNLNPKEIESAIDIMENNPDMDMVIMTRVHTNIQGTWQRANCIFSGERILKTADLKVIYQQKPKPIRYQIEVAINQYMIKNKMRAYWIKSSAINLFKRIKFGGFIKGEIKDLLMHYQMIKYIGVFNYINQVLFFCKKEYDFE